MKLLKMAWKIGVTAAAAVAVGTMWGGGVAHADSDWGEILTGNSFYSPTFFPSPSRTECVALNAADGYYTIGARVFQWNCNGNNDQEWSTHIYGYTNTGVPVYQVINLQSRDCLEVQAANTINGTQVDQSPCGGGSVDGMSNQMWYISPVSGRTSTYTLKPWSALRVGVNMCLDVRGGFNDDGTMVEQWTCNGGNNQQFIMAVG